MTNTSSHSSGKAVLTLIVLPLVLLIISLWQLQRLPDAESRRVDTSAVDEQLAELRAMAQEPKAWSKSVQMPDGKRYGLALAIQKLEAERARVMAGGEFGTAIPTALARIGAASAALVLLVGVGGLLLIRRMGQQAMASRSALLNAFNAGHRLLPWLLVISVTGMTFAVICVGSYELMQTAWRGTQSRGGMKLFIFGAIAVAFMAYAGFRLIIKLLQASRQVFAHEPLVIMGRLASAAEAPGLWQLVKDVASKLGATMPAHIVVGLNEGFFVTENRVRLASGQEVPPGRLLYLPLPYMAFLGRPEVTAIIGHELGHFMGEDTEYSLRFSPIYASAARHLGAIDAVRDEDSGSWAWFSKPASHLGEFFLQAFHESVQHWSRERELAADRVGAAQSSTDAAALALLRSAVLAPRIDQALIECWQSGDQGGSGVLARTRELVKTMGLANPSAHLDDCQSHPTDSHPTTRQRLDALGVPVTPELLRDAEAPVESGLLAELGLDATAQPGTSNAAMPAFAQTLETEFKAAADSQRQERIAFLTQIAKQGMETIRLHEGGRFAMFALGLVALGAFAASILIPDLSVGIRSGIAAAGVAFLVIIFKTLRLRQSPLLTLKRDGMMFANLSKPLPWTSIDDYQVQVISQTGFTMINLTFELAEEARNLVFAGDRRFKMNNGKLVASTQGVRGMSTDAFLGKLHEYWTGGLARAELSALLLTREQKYPDS